MPRTKRSSSKIEQPGPNLADPEVDDGYPPLDDRYRLGCPFAKHNPKRYEAVDTPCTTRWGFKNIGYLKYVTLLLVMAQQTKH